MRAGKQTLELPAGREVQPLRCWLAGRAGGRPVGTSCLSFQFCRPAILGHSQSGLSTSKKKGRKKFPPPPLSLPPHTQPPLTGARCSHCSCSSCSSGGAMIHIILRSRAKNKKNKKKKTTLRVFVVRRGYWACVCVCVSRVAYRALIPACALLPKGSAGVQPAFIIHTRVIRARRVTGERHKGNLCSRAQHPQNYIFFFREVVGGFLFQDNRGPLFVSLDTGSDVANRVAKPSAAQSSPLSLQF